MRFWNVTSRILRGVKRVGGFSLSAVPAGGDWIGVKKGVFGAGVLEGAIVARGIGFRGNENTTGEEKKTVQNGLIDRRVGAGSAL